MLAASFFFANFANAQAQRGTLIHEETIRVSPSADTAKLGEAERGHELIIIESSRDWTHVEAVLANPHRESDEDDEENQGKTITGWLLSKGVVSMSTQNGDKIIFGEASNSEDEASRRRGRRDAANDAMRLYYRVYDLFPTSPLAAEGLYRAADIRWQVERADIMTRPSAREREAYMRGQMDEARHEEISRDEMGRSRRFPPDREQTLRRLARRLEVSRKRSRHVREVRQGTRSIASSSRGLV